MKHIVSMTYEVEAESWDLALVSALRQPLENVTACRVKPAGKRAQYVIPSNLKEVLGPLLKE